MKVVLNNSEVVRFVESRLKVKLHEPHQCFGFAAEDGRPLMAAVFNGFNGANIDLTMVAEPGGITRAAIQFLARHAFQTNGCRRVTVRTTKRNKKALRAAARAGFTYEGVSRGYFPAGDAVVFRMLKDECRWLKNG